VRRVWLERIQRTPKRAGSHFETDVNALILIDIQNDFLPGGALPVPDGDQVIPVANRLMPIFDLVVATQDWHPADHGSFASQHPSKQVGEVIELEGLRQILWPDHCVQSTRGAEFAPGLHAARIQHIVQKGTDCRIDSYSGFFDNGHRKATGLGAYLQDRGVSCVYLVGLATDYCVRFTALDARHLGFDTYVVEDGCRGVELRDGDVANALDEMRAAGIHIIDSGHLSHGHAWGHGQSMTDDFPSHGRLAGIDFGTVRIGIAITDQQRMLASPYENYVRRDAQSDARRFQRLVSEEQIAGFVVGLPVHTSGHESQKSQEARQFGRWLAESTGVPVRFYDERYTSAQAEEILGEAQLTKKKRKKRLDMLAAQIMLAAYLESHSQGRHPPESLDD
jgi:nicotinamidase/pyrazinamidase